MNQREYKKLVRTGRLGRSYLGIGAEFEKLLLFENRDGSFIYCGLIEKNDKYHTKHESVNFQYNGSEILEPYKVLPTNLNSFLLGILKSKEPVNSLVDKAKKMAN